MSTVRMILWVLAWGTAVALAHLAARQVVSPASTVENATAFSAPRYETAGQK